MRELVSHDGWFVPAGWASTAFSTNVNVFERACLWGEPQCKYTDYSLTKVPEKFVALDPNADVLWPGSLVQGKSMAGGILDPVPVKRAPGTITLSLASGGGGPFFKTMPEPSLSAATQAQNEILAAYIGKTPAKFSYVTSMLCRSGRPPAARIDEALQRIASTGQGDLRRMVIDGHTETALLVPPYSVLLSRDKRRGTIVVWRIVRYA